MSAASIVVLLLNTAFGALVLGFWSAPSGQRGDRRSAAFVTVHVATAALSVGLLVVYLAGRSSAVGAVAVGAIAATIALGSMGFLSSRTRRRVPIAVLVIHGGFGVAALVLAALAVGRS